MSEEKELDSILNEIKKKNDDTDRLNLQSESQQAAGSENNGDGSADEEAEFVMTEPIPEESEPQESEYEKAENSGEEYTELEALSEPPKKNNKKIIIIVVAIIAVVAIACGVYFGAIKKSADDNTTAPQTTAGDSAVTEPTSQAPDSSSTNPLTGEAGFAATGKRPVAIVVENAPAARPQWGIDSPDIIVEGEVEGGISRMLWIYADYNSVPSKVGPIRSARPSYVKFSKFFDAVYIHWGGSHSKGNYVGGYKTIRNEGVDDIDGIKGGALFSRDTSRSTAVEHRGILDGTKIESAIKDKSYRTELKDGGLPTFNFNDSIADIGTDKASSLNVKFSSKTDTRKFSYNSSDSKYHSSDWSTDVSFENVIVLMADSTYVSAPYKGGSITYLNYSLTSGSGYLASNGTYQKIKWSATSGTLKITDESGNDITLNKGNSYIGLASSNNGGSVTF